MVWDAIAPALGAEFRDLPAVALASALGDWDATAPHLLRLLEAFRTGDDRSPEVANQLCYLLHLAAEREERRAFTPLCALLRDQDAADAVLGDAIDETLACILVRTYDDDPTPLHALIEDAAAGETVRMSALHALAWLTATGRIPREAAAAYLAAGFGRMEPRGESLAWLGWQDAVAWLGLVDLREAAAELFRRGWVGPEWLEFEDFDAVLREAATATDPLALLRREGPPMFDSAIAELAGWSAFQGDAAADDDDVVLNQPYVNPYRNVGRNDPCPCGSGRKFKKCCLGKV